MFRCIFLPGDLFWIIASDTTHRLRMAFVPKTKGNVTVLSFYVLQDLFSWIRSGIRTPTAPAARMGRSQGRPSKGFAFSMSSRCSSKSKISQCSLPQPGEHREIPTGNAGVREGERRGGVKRRERGLTPVTTALSSPFFLPKVSVPMLLNLPWGQDAI